MKNKRTRRKHKQTRKNKRQRTKKGGMFSSVARSAIPRLSSAAKSIAPSATMLPGLSSKSEVSDIQKLPAYFRQPPQLYQDPKQFGRKQTGSQFGKMMASAASHFPPTAQALVRSKHQAVATVKTATLTINILTDLGFLKNTIPLIISVSVNTDWTNPENVNAYYKQLFGLLDPVIRAAVSKQDLNTRSLAPKLIEQMVEKGSLAEQMLTSVFQENPTFQIALDQAANLFDELMPELWNHVKAKGVNCDLTTSSSFPQDEQVSELKGKIKKCIGVKAYDIGSKYERKFRSFFINKTGGFLYEMFEGLQTMLQIDEKYDTGMEIDLDIKQNIFNKLDDELTNTILSAFIVDVEKIKENPSQPIIQQIKKVVDKEVNKVKIEQFIKFDETVLQQLISNIYERTLDKEMKGLPYTVTDCILESIDLRLSSLLNMSPEVEKIYNQPTVDMCIQELKGYLDKYTDMQKQIIVSCITSRANELFI
jgi:hypothetical protein